MSYALNLTVEQAIDALAHAGYLPLPNHEKSPLLNKWNDPAALTKAQLNRGKWVARYNKLTTVGVVICGGLGVIDIDVNHELAETILARVKKLAPEVFSTAPLRRGGGNFKCALFFRVEGEAFTHYKSGRYVEPGASTSDPTERGHLVEIFGSGLTPGGLYSRQFGVYGRHSEKYEYRWDENTYQLHEQRLDELPGLSGAVASRLIAEINSLFEKEGWQRKVPGHAGGERPKRSLEAREEALGWIAARDGCGWHDEMRDYVAHLAAGGKSLEEIMERAGPYCRGGADDPEMAVLAEGAYEKFKLPKPDTTVLAAQLQAVAAANPAAAAAVANSAPMTQMTAPNWMHRTRGGAPISTVKNCVLAIEALGLKCSYNNFFERPLVDDEQVDDPFIRKLCSELTDAHRVDFKQTHVRDAVLTLCEKNRFDPILDMLAAAQANWDGVKRLDRMAVDYFNADDTELNRECVRITMIAAVRRARQPGCKFDACLVLEGEEGVGKSESWRILAGHEYFSDERLVGKDSKQVMEGLYGVWIHENAEMAGYSKTDTETVKSYMSRTTERCRPAFGHFTVVRDRRSIEVGSTNADVYLLSGDGNRRFWGVAVNGHIDLEALRRDRLQLWGEAAALEAAGASLTLKQELWAVAREEQEERRAADIWEDTLVELARVPTSGPYAHIGGSGMQIIHVVEGFEVVTTKAIGDLLIANKLVSGGMINTRRLATIMRRLGWWKGRVTVNGVQVRGYRRKPAAGARQDKKATSTPESVNVSVVPFKKPK